MILRPAIALFTASLLASPAGWAALSITFDYSFDESGTQFFGSSGTPVTDRRNILEDAATVFETSLIAQSTNLDGSSNELSAISPDVPGGDTWDATFTNPDDGSSDSVSNRSVASGEVIVYVGGRSLGGSTLAVGEVGGFTASGSQAWLDTLEARGQDGALDSPATDFGPWGGSIAFDTSGTTFDFDGVSGGMSDGVGDGTTASGEFDFYTVAVHELAHVLGFGTASSWDTYVDSANDEFEGPQAVAENGGSDVQLDSDEAHLASGTDVLMDPTLTSGSGSGLEREFASDLEFAMMADVWAVPEPESYLAMLPVLALAFLLVRKRWARRPAQK